MGALLHIHLHPLKKSLGFLRGIYACFTELIQSNNGLIENPSFVPTKLNWPKTGLNFGEERNTNSFNPTNLDAKHPLNVSLDDLYYFDDDNELKCIRTHDQFKGKGKHYFSGFGGNVGDTLYQPNLEQQQQINTHLKVDPDRYGLQNNKIYGLKFRYIFNPEEDGKS